MRIIFYVVAIFYFLTSCQKMEDIFPQKAKLVLAPNKVTIQCVNCVVGEKLRLKGVEYEIVDNDLLRQRVEEGAALDRLCTTLVTDMSNLFYLTKFNESIENWDVSHVTDMSFMFTWSKFNQPIGMKNFPPEVLEKIIFGAAAGVIAGVATSFSGVGTPTGITAIIACLLLSILLLNN